MKVGAWVKKDGRIYQVTAITVEDTTRRPVVTLRQYGGRTDTWTELPEFFEEISFCDKCGREVAR
jgi:hypothetical protein